MIVDRNTADFLRKLLLCLFRRLAIILFFSFCVFLSGSGAPWHERFGYHHVRPPGMRDRSIQAQYINQPMREPSLRNPKGHQA